MWGVSLMCANRGCKTALSEISRWGRCALPSRIAGSRLFFSFRHIVYQSLMPAPYRQLWAYHSNFLCAPQGCLTTCSRSRMRGIDDLSTQQCGYARLNCQTTRTPHGQQHTQRRRRYCDLVKQPDKACFGGGGETPATNILCRQHGLLPRNRDTVGQRPQATDRFCNHRQLGIVEREHQENMSTKVKYRPTT